MRLISILDLPDSLRSTTEYINCNLNGGFNEEEKNSFDYEFERFLRCTLRQIDTGWYIELTDEAYTWYIMRWA